MKHPLSRIFVPVFGVVGVAAYSVMLTATVII